MYLAALGNIDGNLAGFEVVLDAIADAGIQTIVNTGNSAVGHAHPNEVIDLLRRRGIISVQGDLDRRVVHFLQKRKTLEARLEPGQFEALQRAFVLLHPDNLEYLRALPRRRDLVREGITVCLCHGTPTSSDDHLSPDDMDFRFQRVRETANTDLIVCGGRAGAFSRNVDQALFVNPGFVNPPEGSRAAFTIINTESVPWETEQRRVEIPL